MASKPQQTIMYSQLQPWSTAGAPPCMEPVSGPEIPPRTGNYYQVHISQFSQRGKSMYKSYLRFHISYIHRHHAPIHGDQRSATK